MKLGMTGITGGGEKPNTSLHKFAFDVCLKGEKVGDRPIRTEIDAVEVANWYYSLTNGFGYYKDLKFEPVKHGNVYRMHCSFRFINAEDEGDMDFHQQLIRDPDEDGNHSIKIDKDKYLVVGSELEKN